MKDVRTKEKITYVTKSTHFQLIYTTNALIKIKTSKKHVISLSSSNTVHSRIDVAGIKR